MSDFNKTGGACKTVTFKSSNVDSIAVCGMLTSDNKTFTFDNITIVYAEAMVNMAAMRAT